VATTVPPFLWIHKGDEKKGDPYLNFEVILDLIGYEWCVSGTNESFDCHALKAYFMIKHLHSLSSVNIEPPQATCLLLTWLTFDHAYCWVYVMMNEF